MEMTIRNPDNFPKRALIAIGFILLATLGSVAAVRIMYQADTVEKVNLDDAVVSRALHFRDHSDGSIGVVDATTNSDVAQILPGTNGFLRSTLRGLARERKLRGLDAKEPFLLAFRNDGRLTIDDPATARHVELNAFGATNAAVFLHFLPLSHVSHLSHLSNLSAVSPGNQLPQPGNPSPGVVVNPRQ